MSKRQKAPKCRCGKTTVIRTVTETGPNRGRKYFGCSQHNSCLFVQWIDEDSITRIVPMCPVHLEATRRQQVTKNTSNKGRWFYRCVHRNCNQAFMWDTDFCSQSSEWREKHCVSINDSSAVTAVKAVATKQSQTKVILELISSDCFELRFIETFADDMPRLNQFLKTYQYITQTDKSIVVIVPLLSYTYLVKTLHTIIPRISIEYIPEHVLNMFIKPQSQFASVQFEEHRIDSLLWSQLKPFQRKGVEFVARKNGVGFIGDEMGLGKTIQAIAFMSYYRAEWPVLVIVPSTLRIGWRDAILRWICELHSNEVIVVTKSAQWPTRNDTIRIVIVSYSLVFKLHDSIRKWRFKIVVADESHFLKSHSSQRTRATQPIIQAATRRLLLSGTPILSRPSELWSQLDSLSHGVVGDWRSFTLRYCNAQQGAFGWEVKGAMNLRELNLILTTNFMIRRLKKDVLSELPPKWREGVIVATTSNATHKKAVENFGVEAVEKAIENGGLSSQTDAMKLFHESGLAKLKASIEFIKTMLDGSEHKFLIFAHHHDVIDSIDEALQKYFCYSHHYIRIDGRVPTKNRDYLIERFQNDKSCRVALLGILAAGTGYTLTAASNIIFVELPWTPSILKQAEDRCHRIGQSSAFVNIQYILGEDTFDTTMWSILQRKLATCETLLHGTSQHDRMKLNIIGEQQHHHHHHHHHHQLKKRRRDKISQQRSKSASKTREKHQRPISSFFGIVSASPQSSSSNVPLAMDQTDRDNDDKGRL